MSLIRSARDSELSSIVAPLIGPLTPSIDPGKALVVGRSPINRVVVSRIIENSGLRPLSEEPEAALKTLQTLVPATIVLDGGADNRDCDMLMQPLQALRRQFGKNVPGVILLTPRIMSADDLAPLVAVDIAVAKPITPELLQPMLERLLERVRG
ncbi:response regulator [Mesorhizobium sp. KR1-2]|uniref:response regulator n=1 Tax=Mesorhizobium sp. KR1-2 TaxID=3156609 RepID=UPI0032B4D687